MTISLEQKKQLYAEAFNILYKTNELILSARSKHVLFVANQNKNK